MRNALKISPEGLLTILDLDAPEGALKVLQTAVEGLIYPIALTGKVDMYVNEEGLFKPLNEYATVILTKATRRQTPLLGNAVLCGITGPEGSALGLTNQEIARWTFLLELMGATVSEELRATL